MVTNLEAALAESASTHAGNPYLEGHYAPVYEESIRTDLTVIGTIPKDIRGAYYRNGPNPRYVPKGRYHWFDGDGMIHAIRFKEGRITYRNRWVRTAGLMAEVKAGQSLFSGLIEPDFQNPMGAIKDNANTDVVFHAGKLYALFYRSGKPYVLNPRDLTTYGEGDFAGKLKQPISAHAKVDARSGEMMVFDFGSTPPYLHYGVVSPQGELVHMVPIPLPGPRFPHDMAITKNHSILMDLPVFLDPEALAANRQRMAFFPDKPARFAVLPRFGTTDQVRWFEAEPCYIYHVINAWEEGREIVMDVCRVSEPIPEESERLTPVDRMKKFMADALMSARYHRYRFNLNTGKTEEQPLFDLASEFPCINQKESGYPTRYSYHASLSPADTLLFDGLIKYDSKQRSYQQHFWGAGRWGSEAVFAPKLGATVEDDGYVICFVQDSNTNLSECLVLDATNLEAEPLARVLLPSRVPLGFHATWVGSDQLNI